MGKDRLPDLLKNKPNFHGELNTDDVIIFNLDYTPKELQRLEKIENFLRQYSGIRYQLEILESNLDEMGRMTQQVNIAHFNENELDALKTDNLTLGQQLMTTFNNLKINLPYDDDFTVEARMKHGLFHGLQKHYNLLWHRNEAFLVTYDTKLKKQFYHHAKILNRNITEDEVEDLIANNNTNMFVDNILLDTENERRRLKDLMVRHSELQKLEKSIQDVHALFIRIQNLVLEQSELIQVIEHHATKATTHIEGGKVEIQESENYYKKSLKKKYCLILFGVVLLIILILFIAL